MPGVGNPEVAQLPYAKPPYTLLAHTLLACALATTSVQAQERGFARLDPPLGIPDGAQSAPGAGRLLTWTHARPAGRGSLTLWDTLDRRTLRSWPYGPRVETEPGTANLEQLLLARNTAALHPAGHRALFVRSSKTEPDPGLFEIDLSAPRSTPRRRAHGRPLAVTWSPDGNRVCWVEANGSLVIAADTPDAGLVVDVRHPVPKGAGHFTFPSPTTACWNLIDGGAWTLDLEAPLEPPTHDEDREWIARLPDGSAVLLDERHVLRAGERVLVDHGFDRHSFDFRGPTLAGVAVSENRIAWFDLVSRRLRIESPTDVSIPGTATHPLRWTAGLGDGGFLLADDRPGLHWLDTDGADALTTTPHPGGDFDQIAWSPDGRYLAVAGGSGLAVFDVRSPDAAPALTREGRHSVSAGLTGPELCIASAEGIEILHAAARRALGAGTQTLGTRTPARTTRRRVDLPTLLNHRPKNPFDVRKDTSKPRRLRLHPLDEERIGISYADNQLVVFEPRAARDQTWSWPQGTGSYLESFAIACFRDADRTLVVTAEFLANEEEPAPVFGFSSNSDGNLVVLDGSGRATDAVRLEGSPTAAIRERSSGDLLVTMAGRRSDSMGLARVDARSLELDQRYVPQSRLLGLAQIGAHEILTWDTDSLLLLDLRSGDTRDLRLPGMELGLPVIRGLAVSPDGSRVGILFADGVLLAETARLRAL